MIVSLLDQNQAVPVRLDHTGQFMSQTWGSSVTLRRVCFCLQLPGDLHSLQLLLQSQVDQTAVSQCSTSTQSTARAVESIRVVVNLYFEAFSSGRYWCSYFFSLSLVFPTHTVTCVSRWNPTAFLTLKHLHLKSSVSNITVCLQPSAPPDPAQKITSSSSSSSSSVSSESSQSSEVTWVTTQSHCILWVYLQLWG